MTDRKVLVPLDNEPLSVQTIKSLIALKKNLTAPLTLLHVLDMNRFSCRGLAEKGIKEIKEHARSEATKFIAEQQGRFAAAGMEVTTLVKVGSARETICELADSGEYALLVVGKHVDSDMRRLVFGPISNYIIHHAKCPVLIV